MTALFEDTAQLPVAAPAAVITLDPPTPQPEIVVTAVPMVDVADLAPTSPPCRSELRAERQRARRLRRIWVGISLVVMGGTLGATVAILELLH